MTRRSEEQLADLLRKRGLTLSTAESCTGGLLAHRITNVPASSAYYLGSIVAYSYSAKESLLGVDHEALIIHGAVSEPVARQMADGARRALGTDLAVSVTGIAGPGGGTAEKPVGLTWIGLATPEGTETRRFMWGTERENNKQASTDAALDWLVAYLTRSR